MADPLKRGDRGFDDSYVDVPFDAIVAAGGKFVWRYLGTDTRCWTRARAEQAIAVGLRVGAYWESSALRALSGFQAGFEDAQKAAGFLDSLDAPDDVPVVLSVDAEVSGSDVEDYFRGFASAPVTRPHWCYGSKTVLDYLGDRQLIQGGVQILNWDSDVSRFANVGQLANIGHNAGFGNRQLHIQAQIRDPHAPGGFRLATDADTDELVLLKPDASGTWPPDQPNPSMEEEMIVLFGFKDPVRGGLFIGVLGAWRKHITTPNIFNAMLRAGYKWLSLDGGAIVQADVFDSMVDLDRQAALLEQLASGQVVFSEPTGVIQDWENEIMDSLDTVPVSEPF